MNKWLGFIFLFLALLGLGAVALSASVFPGIDLAHRNVTVNNASITVALGSLGYCLTMPNNTAPVCAFKPFSGIDNPKVLAQLDGTILPKFLAVNVGALIAVIFAHLVLADGEDPSLAAKGAREKRGPKKGSTTSSNLAKYCSFFGIGTSIIGIVIAVVLMQSLAFEIGIIGVISGTYAVVVFLGVLLGCFRESPMEDKKEEEDEKDRDQERGAGLGGGGMSREQMFQKILAMKEAQGQKGMGGFDLEDEPKKKKSGWGCCLQ